MSLSTRQLGWGLVGPGAIGTRRIAPAINSDLGSRLVAVMSRDIRRAEDCAARYGGTAYACLADLLEDPAVDVVAIHTPNSLHAGQVIAAAEAGKHVFCDKPLATNAADAERAVHACRRSGVRLGMNFTFRHCECYERIHDLLSSDRIGRITAVRIEASSGLHQLSGWRADPVMAGRGVVAAIGVHIYDLVRFLLDAEITDVSAMFDTGAGPSAKLEASSLALLRTNANTLVSVLATSTISNPINDVVIHGEKGRITASGIGHPGYFARQVSGGAQAEVVLTLADGTTSRELLSVNGFERTVASFRTAVEGGRDPSPSGEDGLKSVRVMEALANAATRCVAVLD